MSAGPDRQPSYLALVAIMALLSSNSAISLATSLIAGRCYAHLLPLGEFGILGLAQCLVTLLVLVASLGLSSVLVRVGSVRRADGTLPDPSALRSAALGIAYPALAVMALAVALGHRPLARWTLGGEDQVALLPWLVASAALTQLVAIEIALLSIQRRLRTIVYAGIPATILGTGSAILAIALAHAHGIGPSCLTLPLAQWLIYRWCCPRPARAAGAPATGTGAGISAETGASEVASLRRRLLADGRPLALSALVGTGALYALPSLVTALLGLDHAALYRAASMVAISYLGVLVTSLSQHFMPHVAGISDRAVLSRAIDHQLRLVVVIAGASSCIGILAAAPLMTGLFAAKYAPAIPLLRWFLLGNILRLPSWVMSTTILARSSPWTFLALETVSGAALVGLTVLGLERWGLTGAGFACVAFYAGYLALTTAIVLRQGYRPRPLTLALTTIAVAAAAACMRASA
jgi:O-antigen/teichoic acid export membrane protein